ncbi:MULTISPECIES: hypothetical protein [unclassified Pseudomonas]|uniref:hypothetical protein n=1 Tax=unclassified Pseudomonas TaxID=196821 RepID=UPI000C87C646|nr:MULTISPECIES: hypothetical protein [unclassified Pseudomonas]PMU12479.1 hypothetical protein C1Y11_00425 [Pseudomonas sp. FW305-20]PMU22391.1 hypothetical protein C1Y10_01100 [Pseudomonas sp. FW305-122]PMU43594.1 hypothetical protein C1Y12_02300 [Pseudomonas sp. FW305-47B]PMX64933.1 hypothetical protein C1Y13_02990 [Pseudomonas sp. FW305-33]PMX71198.1 hypothetical protein C1X12_03250 [Pseudomonas sp. FW305-60]
MKITITQVLKNEVTVSGQTLSREYVENIMLPMLVAQCATVQSRKFEIVKVFDEAGLSLAAIPEVAREYAIDKSEKARERLRQQAEANAHAERLREATPRELAQAKAEREARAAAIREQGDRVRAASRNSGW